MAVVIKMVLSLFALLLATQFTAAEANPPRQLLHDTAWDISKPLNGFTFQRAKAVTNATVDKHALRFSRLANIKGRGLTRNSVSGLGSILHSPPSQGQHTYQNISIASDFSTQYAVECGWDGAPIWLLLDTGSSDTWAVRKDFECHDSEGNGYGQALCGFGKSHIEDFRNGAINDLHFYLRYGSGERVSGPMGYADISCGGVTVSGQQAGLANYTYWHGNNMTVGILGLAYPSITSAFYGEIGEETSWNAIQYVPFFTNAVMQGVIDPVFSVTLVKNSSDGIIGWGGLPPVQTRADTFASTDLIVVSSGDNKGIM